MSRRMTANGGAAALFLALGWAGSATAEPALLGGPTLLVHGNYCGLGNNGPLAPIDALDAACARHDACTPDDGLPTKACNARLERDAQAIANDLRQPDHVRMMAGFVAAFASTSAARTLPDLAPVNVRAIKGRTVYTILR